jgi:hypothetical protein
MYSASAPVHILYFARAVGENAVGADNFVLVPSGGSGEP